MMTTKRYCDLCGEFVYESELPFNDKVVIAVRCKKCSLEGCKEEQYKE
jgi:hypothetical protein